MSTSLRRNVVANYLGQMYLMAVGIVMLPIYLRYMGPEAYGLVGFYTMLNAWFVLLDAGFTPVLARETARFRGGATDAGHLLGLVKALHIIFLMVGVIAAVVFWLSSGYVATHWLNIENLPYSDVRQCVILIGLIIPLRWISGLYRGVINGFERQVWVAGFNFAVGTLRFVAVVLVLELYSSGPVAYFGYQLGVAVAELGCLMWTAHRLLPHRSEGRHVTPLEALRAVAGMAFSMAFTSALWVVLGQYDKLVLSMVLPLSEFGFYSLAAMLASGIHLISVPIGQAVLPRLTKFHAAGDRVSFLHLYRKASRLLSLTVGTAAVTMAIFSWPLLWMWTGDAEAALKGTKILSVYAIGYGCFSLIMITYFMQSALGDLRMQTVANLVMIATMMIGVTIVASRGDALSVVCFWSGAMVLYSILFIPFVHRIFVDEIWKAWLLRDVCVILAALVLPAVTLRFLVPDSESRLAAAILIAASATSGIGLAFFTTPEAWNVIEKFRGRLGWRGIHR